MTADDMQAVRSTRYNATVSDLKRIHSDLLVMRVQPDHARGNYLAGQYCTLGLANFEQRAPGCQEESLKPDDFAKLVRRSYSISHSFYAEGTNSLRNTAEDGWVEFYIVLVRENLDGRVPGLTPRLFQLDVGSRLQLGEKIVGHFNLEPVKNNAQDIVLLSTGTGEAPHNSMAADLLRTGHTGRILNACCVRLAKDLGYLETHRKLMTQYPNYTYLPLTTREVTVGGSKKYIQDLITSGELEAVLGHTMKPESTHVFLCGNPKMIGIPAKNKETGVWEYPQSQGVIEILEKRGFLADNATTKTHGNIHFEKYW